MTARRAVPAAAAAVAAVAALALAAPGGAAPLASPLRTGVYADPVVDANRRDDALAAWSVVRPGATRLQARLRTGPRGRFGPLRDLGPGRAVAARLGDTPARALVLARRGARLVALVRAGARWRAETLPRGAGTSVAGVEWAGRRVVLATRTGRRVTVSVRDARGRWSTRGTLALPAVQRLHVAVGEGSGTVAAAWSRARGVPVADTARWRAATGRWEAPVRLLPLPPANPEVLAVAVNRRGDVAVLVAPGSGAYGYGPGGGAYQVALRRRGEAVVALSPGMAAARIGLAPDGSVVAARATGGESTGEVSVIEAIRWRGAGAWSAPRVVATDVIGDLESPPLVSGVAVTASGRAVVSWYVDPGPAPAEHRAALERTPGGRWGRSVELGALYGPILLAPGGRGGEALYVSDPSGREVPEHVAIR